MWNKIIAYFPDFQVLIQGLVAYIVPYFISLVYSWTQKLDGD